MRNYEYFGILRSNVGMRIIRGCVLYAENYGIYYFNNLYNNEIMNSFYLLFIRMINVMLVAANE